MLLLTQNAYTMERNNHQNNRRVPSSSSSPISPVSNVLNQMRDEIAEYAGLIGMATARTEAIMPAEDFNTFIITSPNYSRFVSNYEVINHYINFECHRTFLSKKAGIRDLLKRGIALNLLHTRADEIIQSIIVQMYSAPILTIQSVPALRGASLTQTELSSGLTLSTTLKKALNKDYGMSDEEITADINRMREAFADMLDSILQEFN